MPDENYLSLVRLMANIPSGKIESNSDISSEIERTLYEVWSSLDGVGEGGMAPYKLLGRMESIVWAPPFLSFKIERHGGTVMGSVYGELQNWVVNVDGCTVRLDGVGKRLLGKRQPPLDVKPLVAEIVALIADGCEDDRLKWKNKNQRVQVQIGKIIPDNVIMQTLIGRRKRFSTRLQEALAQLGWQKVSGPHHTYEKIPGDPRGHAGR